MITVPASNPGGPVFLANGSLLLPFQTWTPGRPCTNPTCITLAAAPHWSATPYRHYPLGVPGAGRGSCVERYEPPKGMSGSVEDPSNVWRDRRGNLHMLMHQARTGGRAWSEDSGRSWRYNYSTTSYPFSPALSDGTVADCGGPAAGPGSVGSRGEPRVLLDRDTGLPSMLSTVCLRGRPAAGSRQHWSRILLQRINT